MDMETLRQVDMVMEMGKFGNIDMKHENMEKWRHRDMETCTKDMEFRRFAKIFPLIC